MNKQHDNWWFSTASQFITFARGIYLNLLIFLLRKLTAFFCKFENLLHKFKIAQNFELRTSKSQHFKIALQ